MAVTFPTKFDVREVRDQANKAVADAVDPLRAPSLAFLGLGDVAVASARDAVARVEAGAVEVRSLVEELPRELQELRTRLSAEDFRRLADSYAAVVRSVYVDLVKRGETAYSKLTSQPQVKQALDTVDQVSSELEGRLESTVEEIRVRGEAALGEVTRQTRSVGERTSRRIARSTEEIAETVSEAGDDLAETVREVGGEAASETRSAAGRTSAKTAPRKQGPKNAPTGSLSGHAPKK